jgi:error-prone DNA polymerase
LSLKAHPVSFVRSKLESMRVMPTARLPKMVNGDIVAVAGLVTVRQRPGTAKGVIFVTIEDETGFANLVVWGKVFDTYRRDILQARLLMVQGKVQIEGEVIHVIANSCYNLSYLLNSMADAPNAESAVSTLSRSDEKDPEEVFYKGRNFR